MKDDIIIMKRKELKRLYVIKNVLAKEISWDGAAKLLALSIRQIGRLVSSVRKLGDKGIVHKLRGRSCNRKFSDLFKNEVREKYREKYWGFGPTLASEKFFEIEGIKISDETLRKWLITEGGECEWRRKGRKYRQWRERKWYYGEMVQMDGSDHDWLEGRGPELVLMGYIDDATGKVYGRFYNYEGTIPAMDSLKRYIKKNGLPQSIYLDRHSTYKSTREATIEEELSGEWPMSEFERAANELGIKIIHAYSPQAKGRIERLFRTFQDRVIKEMRLRGIRTLEEANKFLEYYLPIYNRRFCVIPKENANLHQGVAKGVDLDRILCIKTERKLRNDWTIMHDRRLYQVLEKTPAKKVSIEERVNGKMYIYYKEQRLKFREIVNRPEKVEKIKLSELPFSLTMRKKYIPPADHPWRRSMGMYFGK